MLSLYYRAPGAGTKHRFFFPSVAAECTTSFTGSLLVLTASQQGDGEREVGKHRVASSVTASGYQHATAHAFQKARRWINLPDYSIRR